MAEQEYEALVGHLFIVDGRSMSTASPGALAMSAPRKAARGRDRETLFSLLTLDQNQHRPASFYENQVAETADIYYRTPGSATAALRTALSDLGSRLYAENTSADLPLLLGYSCAILRGQEVLLALIGPVRCILYHDGMLERLPSYEEIQSGTIALGQRTEPEVRYFRREIRDGDFLILSDSTFDRISNEVLQQALATGEIETVLNSFVSVLRGSSSAQIIRFIPSSQPHIPSTPVAEDMPVTTSTAAVSAPVAAHLESPVATPSPPMTTRSAVQTHKRASRNIDIQASLRGAGRGILDFFSRVMAAIKTIFEKTLPEDNRTNPMTQRWDLKPTTQAAIALSVVLITAVLTTVVYRFRGQTSKYAQLVREAQSEIESAKVVSNSQSDARPHWEAALFLLDEAAEIREPGQEIAAMYDEAKTALDTYDSVTRVYPTLLREYGEGITFADIVVNGLHIYLLDEVNDIIYREDLLENGSGLTNREPIVIVRQNDVINGQFVGGFVDITWMEEGAFPQQNVLAGLTRNGLLVTYSPSWDVSAVALPGFEGWQDVRSLAVYDEDLYILDAGANEIWVYPAGSQTYSSVPNRYFTDEIPNLTDALDMCIDTNGNIFVLHANGMITKYFMGKREPFAYEGLPQPVVRTNALYLSVNLVDRSLLVADNGGGRIYSVSLVGGFQANYRDDRDEVFDHISGIATLDLPSFVYITSGNSLYAFSR